jgi:hypothetical protein
MRQEKLKIGVSTRKAVGSVVHVGRYRSRDSPDNQAAEDDSNQEEDKKRDDSRTSFRTYLAGIK